MRDLVLKVFEKYSEGGSIGAAIDSVNMKHGDFYKTKRQHPDLQALYLEIQMARADMMYDEAYAISEDVLDTELKTDPRSARVAADIRMKIAAAFDRDRFGDNVKIDVRGTIDLSTALIEAKQRASQPGRNLETVSDAEYEVLPHVQRIEPPDLQSDNASVPAGFVDPFSDD